MPNREGLVRGGKRGGATQAAKEHLCGQCGKTVKGNFGWASHQRMHRKSKIAALLVNEADNKIEKQETAERPCTPGAEWACKLATGGEETCHCACGGLNHGMYATGTPADVAGAVVDSLDDDEDPAILGDEDFTPTYRRPIR